MYPRTLAAWFFAACTVSSAPVAAGALPSGMTWFRIKHAQITDIAEGSDGWSQIGVYADGEWHAQSCYDTIPADSPTVINIGPARLVVPAAAWQITDKHTFTYSANDRNHLWRVSIDIDRGTWWVWMQDQETGPWRTMATLPVGMTLNGFVASEELPLTTPDTRDGMLGYYQAGVVPMTCLSLNNFSVNRSPRGKDWWSSYVHLQGVYNLSDCRQSANLHNVGARLRMGWTSLVVPVGGFKPAAHGWFTYTHQSNTLTWWLSVHPRSGAFTVHMWSTAADISTGDHRVDVSLQLSDQLGQVQVQGVPLTSAKGYTTHGDVRQACPMLP